MVSRAAHYRAKAKHDQRQFGEVKPKLAARDTDTTWMPEFISSIQGLTGYFTYDSIIALGLGAEPNERLQKLRKLSSMGILRMYAHREDGLFVEYRWELTPAGRH